jgi:hypothetical protein
MPQQPLKSPLAVIVRLGDEGEHPLQGALERALDKDGRKTMRASVCPGGASAQAVSHLGLFLKGLGRGVQAERV